MNSYTETCTRFCRCIHSIELKEMSVGNKQKKKMKLIGPRTNYKLMIPFLILTTEVQKVRDFFFIFYKPEPVATMFLHRNC